MNPRAASIFRNALDLMGSARDEYISSECAGDLDLLAQVQKLLDKVDASAELEVPKLDTDAVLATLERKPISSVQSGQSVGPFRLLRELGSGGMGAVWLAERVGGFQQLVAIKWLHAGLSHSARARFSRERELLAKLEHPGIARIVDGGTSGEADWYAMEYVEGQTLSAYAKANALELPQLLGLMIQLCEAVQFAHQHLIVHRDLKPGNVMIDPQGKAKLLDFGVAKNLSEVDSTASSVPMTMAYAAPEQIKGQSISTQTDVYALGVILFELLTGSRPHKARADSALSLLQAITDTDATAPSHLLRTHAGHSKKISARALQGDLDTIVLKALNREPARRYASAQALSEDLQRFLAHEPIQARPDTRWYRVRKFVRRNRALAAVATLSLLAILGFAWRSQQDAHRAEQARVFAEQETARARAVQTFLTDLFSKQRPDVAQGRNITAKDLLDDAEHQLTNQAESISPEVRSELLKTLANLRYDLNDFDSALRHNEASLNLAARRFGQHSTPYGLALIERADTLWWLGRIQETLAQCDQGLTILRGANDLRDEALEQAHTMALITCADSFRSADQYQRTKVLQDQAEQRLNAHPSLDAELNLLRSRAKLAQVTSDYSASIQLNTQLIAHLEANPSTPPSDIATLYHGRGATFFALGDSQSAEKDFRIALQSHLRTFGPNGVLVASSRRMLALVLADLGKTEDAEREMQNVLAVARAHFEPSSGDFAWALYGAGLLQLGQAQPEPAAELFQEALRAQETSYGPTHSLSQQIRLNLLDIRLQTTSTPEVLASDALQDARDQAQAFAKLNAEVELKPEIDLKWQRLQLRLARLASQRERLSPAKTALLEAIKRAPYAKAELGAAWHELALLARTLHDPAALQSAQTELSTLLELMPKDTQRRNRLERLLAEVSS